VIESVLVVDMRDETTGVCAAGDWVDHGFRINASVEADGRNLATLAEIVADIVVRNASATNMQSAARYELTIRFPDGASSTIRLANQPRWKPGERVRVINNQT
jgi:outer membrane lipoprotein SlyB